MPEMPAKTRMIQKGANKTFGADFGDFGAVKSGGTLSNPQVHVPAAANVLLGTPEVNLAEFIDDGDGEPIPANEGVICRYDCTNAVPGTYRIEFRATVGGEKLIVSGRLIITDPPPA